MKECFTEDVRILTFKVRQDVNHVTFVDYMKFIKYIVKCNKHCGSHDKKVMHSLDLST